MDFAAFRREFPTLERLTYLSSGSYGLLSHRASMAIQTYLDDRVRLGADWGGWVEKQEQLRALLARLLAVETPEVAVTASASAGINALASCLDFSERRRIVVSNYEFPTSGQIWHAQAHRGAEIVHVAERPDRTFELADFERAITPDTAVVALSHVCYRHGGRMSDDLIRGICQVARARGALVVLDCFQVIGTRPIEPRALGVDALVGGMLKYLLGSAGSGFLYVRGDLAEQLQPTATGWFAQADPGAMSIFRHEAAPQTLRFQAGTPPVPSIYSAIAGLETLGVDRIPAIAARIDQLTAGLLARLADAAIDTVTPAEHGPMIAIPVSDEAACVDYLAERGVIVTSRDGNIRAGLHAYNNEDDLDRLVEVLSASRFIRRGA